MSNPRNFVMAGSLALVCSAAAWATLPGVWEVTTSMQGAPSGERKSSATACVNVTQMKSGFEQAMLDISASGTLKGGLKCVVTDLVRSSAGSKWKASCEGPVGAMQGSGAATTEGASASLIQSFELQTPFGARPLKQVLQAKRLGDCK